MTKTSDASARPAKLTKKILTEIGQRTRRVAGDGQTITYAIENVLRYHGIELGVQGYSKGDDRVEVWNHAGGGASPVFSVDVATGRVHT